MNNKDEITNNLILIGSRLKETISLTLKENDLKDVAKELEEVEIKLSKLLYRIDITNF